MPAIKDKYKSEIVPKLMEEFELENIMQVPAIKKIVINIGLGEAVSNSKVIDSAFEDLRAIAGQQPIVTRARRSIAGFKLREGMRIGCCVTLRRDKMYEFFERLVSVALPRVRDFRGVSTKAFDGQGNYSLGIREQLIFPEVDYDKIDKIRGMNITIVTSAVNDDQGRALLRHLGMPFRR